MKDKLITFFAINIEVLIFYKNKGDPRMTRITRRTGSTGRTSIPLGIMMDLYFSFTERENLRSVTVPKRKRSHFHHGGLKVHIDLEHHRDIHNFCKSCMKNWGMSVIDEYEGKNRQNGSQGTRS